MRIMFLLVFSCVLLTFCKSTNTPKHPNYEDMAVNHFGSKYHSVYNADSTFIICKSAKQENRTNFTEFFVYDVTEGKSIYQSADRVRSVEWVDNNLIMVRVLTGMPTGEGTNDDYTYNVTEKRIIK